MANIALDLVTRVTRCREAASGLATTTTGNSTTARALPGPRPLRPDSLVWKYHCRVSD